MIMKKITLIIFLSLFALVSNSQCPPNNSENSIVASTNDGFVQTLASDVETFEFVTVTDLVLGDNYLFTSSRSGNDDYITITNTSNVVIASGISPLPINNISLSSLRIHIRVDASCITDTYFHKVTLIDLTVAPSTCQKPTVSPATTLTYRSDTRMDITWYAPEYSTPEGYEWMFVPQGGGTSFSGSTVAPNTSISTGDVLMPNTTYDISIRSTCGVNGNSDYTTFSIKTNTNSPPTNDFCSEAIKLIEQTGVADAASAASTEGSLLGGAGTDVDAELCNGDTGNARDDVWYKFVAKTTDVNITVEPISSFDAVITLYSGSCGSLSYLSCSDIYANSTSAEEINYTGLTIGQTYYARTYSFGSTTPATPTFNIKIWSTSPATDADNDGYVESVDCNDNDPMINPETVWYLDADGDNYAISSVTQCTNPGAGYTISVLPLTDCDDNDSSINPDTIWYLDADIDNYAVSSITQCTSPGAGYTKTTLPLGDCDDSRASVNPNATEVCDGLDNDCDGDIDEGVTSTFYADVDNDGYGDPTSFIQACSAPPGYVSDNSDCDDSRFAVNPGQTEIEGNGLDDDCNPSTPDNPLGVEDFNLDKVKISPNPFNQSITIQVPSVYDNDNFNIGLYDLNGREIFRKNVLSINNNITIDYLNSLQQGIYLIKITNKEDNKSVVRELIKY